MMKYTRVYTDSNGASHFDDVETELSDAGFAPPAPPLLLSPYYATTRFVFCGAPAGWFGDWHLAPKRQIIFYLRGKVEIEVSDGEIRHFGPGDIVLLEDTIGVGHIGRIGEAEDMLSAVVQLSD